MCLSVNFMCLYVCSSQPCVCPAEGGTSSGSGGRSQPAQVRNLIKPKPMMFPVDSREMPRDCMSRDCMPRDCMSGDCMSGVPLGHVFVSKSLVNGCCLLWTAGLSYQRCCLVGECYHR